MVPPPNAKPQNEDPIFYGFEVRHDNGETNVYFELKEADKTFKPVTVDASNSAYPSRGTRVKKGMFNNFVLSPIAEDPPIPGVSS